MKWQNFKMQTNPGDKYSDAVEHFNNKDEFLEHFKINTFTILV